MSMLMDEKQAEIAGPAIATGSSVDSPLAQAKPATPLSPRPGPAAWLIHSLQSGDE